MRAAGPALCATVVVLAGCGGSGAGHGDPSLVPRPVGAGAAFRPPSLSAPVAARTPVAGLRCAPARAARYGVHVELFAAGRVVVVPAGIGVAPPRRVDGAYVEPATGSCSYGLRTREPTGVVEVASARTPTLRDLFALWGQPLRADRLAGFRGRVRVAVGGRAVATNDPGSVALTPHAEIVVQVGPRVVPHPSYRFAPGL